MPFTWRERFEQAGESNSKVTLPRILQHFRKQEKLAIKKQEENNKSQRASPKRSFNKHPHKPYSYPRKEEHRGSRDSTAKPSSPKKPFTNKRKVSDTDPCPVHDHEHSWGDCHADHCSEHNRKRHRKVNANKNNNDNKKPAAETGAHCAAQSSANKGESKDDVEMGNASDASGLNKENMSDFESQGNSFTSVSTVADVSSFALTDIFMSHFDKQKNEESSAEASQSFMQCMSESHISGDESKTDEINCINQDAKASLSLRPVGLALAKKTQNAASDKPLKTLFDPGSDKTFINRRVLPTGVNGKTVEAVNALNETDEISQKAVLEGLALPEFSATQRKDKNASACVFDQPDSPSDLIFGLDLLVPLGIDISCLTHTMTWLDEGVPWKPKSHFNDANLADSVSYETHCFFVNSSDGFDEWIESHSTTTVNVKESKCGKVDTDCAAKQQMHLTPEQQIDLAEAPKDCTPLFNGKLRCYPGCKVHLELNADAKPFHARPCPVPENTKAVFKAELEHLVQTGALSRTGPAEWLSPTFAVPKKDGGARWVSDFRALNKVIKRKVCTSPRVQDVPKKRSGCKFFTKLDVSMQHCTFELDNASKDLCAICTLFGKCRCNQLPMGVKQSPDAAQEIMDNLSRDLDETDVHIDDADICSNSWIDHLKSMRKVLAIL
jgi:hypothetical protein